VGECRTGENNIFVKSTELTESKYDPQPQSTSVGSPDGGVPVPNNLRTNRPRWMNFPFLGRIRKLRVTRTNWSSGSR